MKLSGVLTRMYRIFFEYIQSKTVGNDGLKDEYKKKCKIKF